MAVHGDTVVFAGGRALSTNFADTAVHISHDLGATWLSSDMNLGRGQFPLLFSPQGRLWAVGGLAGSSATAQLGSRWSTEYSDDFGVTWNAGPNLFFGFSRGAASFSHGCLYVTAGCFCVPTGGSTCNMCAYSGIVQRTCGDSPPWQDFSFVRMDWSDLSPPAASGEPFMANRLDHTQAFSPSVRGRLYVWSGEHTTGSPTGGQQTFHDLWQYDDASSFTSGSWQYRGVVAPSSPKRLIHVVEDELILTPLDWHVVCSNASGEYHRVPTPASPGLVGPFPAKFKYVEWDKSLGISAPSNNTKGISGYHTMARAVAMDIDGGLWVGRPIGAGLLLHPDGWKGGGLAPAPLPGHPTTYFNVTAGLNQAFVGTVLVSDRDRLDVAPNDNVTFHMLNATSLLSIAAHSGEIITAVPLEPANSPITGRVLATDREGGTMEITVHVVVMAETNGATADDMASGETADNAERHEYASDVVCID